MYYNKCTCSLLLSTTVLTETVIIIGQLHSQVISKYGFIKVLCLQRTRLFQVLLRSHGYFSVLCFSVCIALAWFSNRCWHMTCPLELVFLEDDKKSRGTNGQAWERASGLYLLRCFFFFFSCSVSAIEVFWENACSSLFVLLGQWDFMP